MVDLFKYPTVSSLVGYLSGEETEPTTSVQPEAQAERQRRTTAQRRRRFSEERGAAEFGNAIAVIGMQCRFPGSKNAEEFWRNLREGKEAITFFTDDELRAAGVSPDALKDPNYVKARGRLEDVDLFDAAFFGFTPREAEIMDPQHRALPRMCVGGSGARRATTPDRYDGSHRRLRRRRMGLNNYLFNLYSNPELIDAIGDAPTTYANDKDFLATRVSYKLNLRGPSLSVQTACSTSLVAVHLACQSLLGGECDMALAGGVTIQCAADDRLPLSRGRHPSRPTGTAAPSTRARRARCSATASASWCSSGSKTRWPTATPSTPSSRARPSTTTARARSATRPRASTGRPRSSPRRWRSRASSHAASATSRRTARARGLGDPIEMAALTQAFRAATPDARLLRRRLGQDQHRPPRRGGGRGRADQDGAGAQARGDSAEPALRAAQPGDRLREQPLLRQHAAATLGAVAGRAPRRGQLLRHRRHERARRAGGSAARRGTGSGQADARYRSEA